MAGTLRRRAPTTAGEEPDATDIRICAKPAPVCGVCADTHVMVLGEREAMCTHCPLPCGACRKGGTGAYCTATPCACPCHT